MSKNENKKVGKVKTFLERKNEEAASLQKKEEQIKEILNTIKSNSKFAKLLLTSYNPPSYYSQFPLEKKEKI